MNAIASKLESLLNPGAVTAWEALDPTLRAQIIQAAPDAVDCIVYPATAAELAEVVAYAHAHRWRILPCGHGSKLHWGGLATDIQIAVSTAKLNRLIEHASGDLTVTAEAGLSLVELQSRLMATGQFLAVDPAYATQATLGGIVATADTGGLRQRYGGIRDMLIGIELVRSDGKFAKAGGRVVKNVAGYDLMKLLTGSYGTLGILTQVTFRIYPLPPTAETLAFSGDAAQIAQAAAALLASALTPTAVGLLTPSTVAALGLGADVGMVVRFQSIDVSVAQQSQQMSQLAAGLGLTTAPIPRADADLLWQQLPELINPPSSSPTITCKIGVEPAQAVATLQHNSLASALGVIHASSGLGIVQLLPSASIEQLSSLRQWCQAAGGFLTVLAAPVELKQQLDVWGYSGNALSVMQRLKAQFDPENLLSPCRFVGGI